RPAHARAPERGRRARQGAWLRSAHAERRRAPFAHARGHLERRRRSRRRQPRHPRRRARRRRSGARRRRRSALTCTRGGFVKLSGIRVLDLSRFLPGPWIGLTMADHGAEVIRIESLEGEPTRRLGPPLKGRGETAGYSAYFRNTQRGKRYLALNLKAPEGREIFLRLAEQSDVVIDSFRPGEIGRAS